MRIFLCDDQDDVDEQEQSDDEIETKDELQATEGNNVVQ